MIKIALLTFLLIFLSSCHQGSSYVSRYGQSIVLNPNQKEVKEIKSKNILNKEPNKLAKKEQTKNNYTKVNSDIFKNINFSSTKDDNPDRNEGGLLSYTGQRMVGNICHGFQRRGRPDEQSEKTTSKGEREN